MKLYQVSQKKHGAFVGLWCSILALPELQVHVMLSGITGKVKPDLHKVVKIAQKDLKDKDSELQSFFLCNSNK